MSKRKCIVRIKHSSLEQAPALCLKILTQEFSFLMSRFIILQIVQISLCLEPHFEKCCMRNSEILKIALRLPSALTSQ